MQPEARLAGRDRGIHPGLQTVLGVAVVAGVLIRLVSFLSVERLFQQYPTEDGYLMLTISRNLGTGLGFSIAQGEIPTNGTQPLLTLIYALGFSVFGGDRAWGVGFALALQIVMGAATAWMIYRLGLRVMARFEWSKTIAAVAAVVWFSSAVTVHHTMNCLETGAYAMVVAAVALVFLEPEAHPPWSWPKTLGVGILLGLAFWIRNDACFLILAACLVHLYGARENPVLLRARFARTLVFGSTSVLVAIPWLAYNYSNFGHLVPVSGRAEGRGGTPGGNIPELVVVVTEYASGVLALPHTFEVQPLAIALCTAVVVAGAGLVVWMFRFADEVQRQALLMGGIFIGCLALFYGGFFGAGWFMGRYILPTTPFIYLLFSFCLVGAIVWAQAIVPLRAAATVVVVLLAGVTLYLHGRIYARGTDHQHFQVVEWVQENVGEEVWVGAVQTGTLGFFHERTINLDGKVNPIAYERILEQRIPQYVVEETPIEYLADWYGIAEWANSFPVISQNFRVVVADEEGDLGVLERVTPLTVHRLEARR